MKEDKHPQCKRIRKLIERGIYYREGNYDKTHCYWEIASMENEEKTIKVYFLQWIEGDEKLKNTFEVYSSEDYSKIKEQLRVLRMTYPKYKKISFWSRRFDQPG